MRKSLVSLAALLLFAVRRTVMDMFPSAVVTGVSRVK